MKCKNCGAEIDNDSNFCEYCGEQIHDDVPEVKKKDHNSNAKKFWWCSLIIVTLVAAAMFLSESFGTITKVGVVVLVALGLSIYRVAFSTNDNEKSSKNE